MEVAGVVLAVLPLVITALQVTKDVKREGSRFLKRRKHVERLIRALREQELELSTNLKWLLKAVDEPYLPTETDSLLLKRPDVQSKVVEYLGSEGRESFNLAWEAAEQALERIATSIQGFLPTCEVAGTALETLKQRHSRPDTKFQFRASLKLMLGEEEVNQMIVELESSNKRLGRLQNTAMSIRQIEATTPSRSSRKLTNYLVRIQEHANRLHGAISLGWRSNCHPDHAAGLILEDRVEAAPPPPASRKQPLAFKIILGSPAMNDMIWHESQVKVVDDEPETISVTVLPAKVASTNLNSSRPTVTFAATSSTEIRTRHRELENICLTVKLATQEKKSIEMYLMASPRLRFCHCARRVGCGVASRFDAGTSLGELLSASGMTNDRSKKLPLKRRLFLGLNLASSLVQLVVTPWLGARWSKNSIHFLPHISGADSETSTSVDLSRPHVLRNFHAASVAPWPSGKSPEPRDMILELGIMLLELFNEMTLESYSEGTGVVVNDNRYDRLSLANRWLDESVDDLLPACFEVTSRCVRCAFDGVPVLPAWDDVLFSGLVRGVIEPLQELCKPRGY